MGVSMRSAHEGRRTLGWRWERGSRRRAAGDGRSAWVDGRCDAQEYMRARVGVTIVSQMAHDEQPEVSRAWASAGHAHRARGQRTADNERFAGEGDNASQVESQVEPPVCSWADELD